jgi:hypothetical protein
MGQIMTEKYVELRVSEDVGIERRNWPISRGIPLAEGALQEINELWLEDGTKAPVAAQFRLLARWPDGSLKWVLTDFQADVPANGEAVYRLCWGEGKKEAVPHETLKIIDDEERVVVCSGPLCFGISRKAFGLFEFVHLGERADGSFVVEHDAVPQGIGGEAWVNICESFWDGDGKRRIYGMGGKCRASLAPAVYKVEVEEAGPLRAVIRCEGAFEADVPMHHYAGYCPMRFILRIYAYAGQPFVRVLHTAVVAFNPRETEVEEIGVRVPVQLTGTVSCRIGGERDQARRLAKDETLVLSQVRDNHCRLERWQGLSRRQLAEAEVAPGWMTVEDETLGVGVALRHMAEEFPKALAAGGMGEGIDVFLWRDADGGRLSCKRYAEAVAWEEGEGVYADGTGTAKTSEFFVAFYANSSSAAAPQLLQGLLQAPQLRVDPAWMSRCRVTGGLAPADATFPAAERMMQGFAEWAARNIKLSRWYGFFDWGDMLVDWDAEKDDWSFHGRWGWCNSEWDPRHGIWIHYMRSGQADFFALGEAMTRHSVDVDTCHFHPFRPYMVGACFRHSTDHFSDEPCASHTFVDNWVDYYYLTGDLRTLEVLKEAGEFFLRYRWSEDPAYGFSLRSTANTLRGLLYLWEISGEPRFKKRTEALYEAVARGQNEDGSWHKRFQISTPDKRPDQGPYGMATEGTTLAVEMGTAPPFTDWEQRALRGDNAPLVHVLPLAEQKGYQTHYLMIGLELMHRLTGREDVAKVYLRAVDWFCGSPEALSEAAAIAQVYGGVICRHLGYAYGLSGNPRYLEIGQAVLQHLIRSQDWSDHPKRRGAVGMSPMYLSLHFFGVPLLLGALKDAGMGEGEAAV